MTPEQARELFNEHREPGDLAHYGEKAAVAAILAAVNQAVEVGFVATIHDRTPNGEWIEVQHHSNGDWSVASDVAKRDAASIRKIAIEVAAGFVSADYPSEREIQIAESGIRAALAAQPATSK